MLPWTNGLPLRNAGYFVVSLGPEVPGDHLGVGQGRKYGKTQICQLSKGMPNILCHGNHAVLEFSRQENSPSFPRPFLISYPLDSGDLPLLSHLPLLGALFALSGLSPAEMENVRPLASEPHSSLSAWVPWPGAARG